MEKRKSVFDKIKPAAEKVAIDTLRGYIFGSVVGAFIPSNSCITTSMHKNGRNFAKMAAAYSITELVLETTRDKDDIYNKIVAGGIAGASCSKNKKAGAIIFGGYSGLAYYFGQQ